VEGEIALAVCIASVQRGGAGRQYRNMAGVIIASSQTAARQLVISVYLRAVGVLSAWRAQTSCVTGMV